jgi:hypothetical protein
MPCWTVEASQVEFLEKSTDLDLLKKALESLKYEVQLTSFGLMFYADGRRVVYEKRTGKITATGVTVDVDAIKRAYSKQAVERQAVKQGWKVKWSVSKETGNEVAEVIKRRY